MTDENPKTTLLNLIKSHFNEPESQTKVYKNGSSDLISFHVTYAMPEEEIRTMFAAEKKGYDVVFTIGSGGPVSVKKLGLHKNVHIGDFNVEVWVLDKEGITAEKVRRACSLELRRIFTAYQKNPGGVLSSAKKVNEREDDRPGTPLMFHSIVRIQTWEYEST